KTYSPISGKEVKKHTVDDVVAFLSELEDGTKVLFTAPIEVPNIETEEFFHLLEQQGYNRIEVDGEMIRLNEADKKTKIAVGDKVNIIIDRIVISHDADNLSRMADSAQTAFQVGHGYCQAVILHNGHYDKVSFSNKYEEDGILFEEPTEYLFNFNNPIGACPRCEGYGKIIGIDEDLVVPDKNLSIYENAIVCWKGDKMSKWRDRLVRNAHLFDFPIHTPYYELTEKQKELLWKGNRYFYGLNTFFKFLDEQKFKIQYRVMLSRFSGKTTCPECDGKRLKKEASYVKIAGKSINDLVSMPIDQLYDFFAHINLDDTDKSVAERLLKEITTRLQYLVEVGLPYLTLNRLSSTLSGGESQRINLATALGSNLVGSMYILDEPSIGLHPRDTNLLIDVLKKLRDMDNTVIVVEHEEEIIKAADEIIDIGPLAGRLGGEIVYKGPISLSQDNESLTADYLTGRKCIPVPTTRRPWHSYIEIIGARENNLKNIDVRFPLHTITAVTGVSGSGKSSLVRETLYKYLDGKVNGSNQMSSQFQRITGDISSLTSVEMIDQNPIGKSTRSNPVTYLKAYDEIRKLMAEQQASIQNNFKASHFSFNTEGGRCEECQGEGIIKVDMQFMADVEMVCEACKGHRFKKEVLEVKYNGKNIYEILEMTIDEVIDFLKEHKGRTEE
ncbi:MAG: excinuclease ABC subunit UvrA, partial [Bacteroidales bacterium]|nr:excinuclease ABC subunit UvrA [Bacteroidales bacterium]